MKKLRVAISGNGPDLALLHGWGMDMAIWDGLATHLRSRFTVHNVALPGYGGSVPCVPYDLDGVVERLAATLPSQVRVCGWSWGGQIALAWAAKCPVQVERLILIATTPRFVRDNDWACAISADMLETFAHSLDHDSQATLQRFAMLQARDDADMRSVSRILRASVSAHAVADAATLHAGLRLLLETDLRGLLGQIAQPARIVHGERDTLVPLAAGVYLRSTLINASLEIIDGSAHAPFIAHPARVAQCISEFCSG